MISAEAESLMLSELGLANLDLSHALFYERDYSEIRVARRWDAEHFEPSFRRILALLAQSGVQIGDVAILAKRRFPPPMRKQFPLHRDRRCRPRRVGGECGDCPAADEAPRRATWIVRPGDVIISTVRPIRRLCALISEEQDGCVCSSGFAVLHPKAVAPGSFLPTCGSPLSPNAWICIPRLQCTPAVTAGDILSLPFPAPSSRAAEEIVAKVRSARSARQKSIDLLDEAKRMVDGMVMGDGQAPQQLR